MNGDLLAKNEYFSVGDWVIVGCFLYLEIQLSAIRSFEYTQLMLHTGELRDADCRENLSIGPYSIREFTNRPKSKDQWHRPISFQHFRDQRAETSVRYRYGPLTSVPRQRSKHCPGHVGE